MIYHIQINDISTLCAAQGDTCCVLCAVVENEMFASLRHVADVLASVKALKRESQTAHSPLRFWASHASEG
jgi:hypothetical protein